MALLQNLISILKDAFSNVVALSGFFARHPQALWAIGGVVGLAALALIFQPYFRALMILRP